jgi:hypothetical protein
MFGFWFQRADGLNTAETAAGVKWQTAGQLGVYLRGRLRARDLVDTRYELRSE